MNIWRLARRPGTIENNDETEQELQMFLEQNAHNNDTDEDELDNNELEQGYVNRQQEGYWEG